MGPVPLGPESPPLLVRPTQIICVIKYEVIKQNSAIPRLLAASLVRVAATPALVQQPPLPFPAGADSWRGLLFAQRELAQQAEGLGGMSLSVGKKVKNANVVFALHLFY